MSSVSTPAAPRRSASSRTTRARSLRSARRRRQPAGGRRARGREGSPSTSWRRRSATAESSRRRSASASPASIGPTTARRCAGIMRRIGYKARVLVVNDALVALEAGAPGPTRRRRHLRHRVDRLRPQRARTRPRAPAAGATCSATRAAATGLAAPRCARCCARPIGAGRRRALTPLLLKHFGVAAAQGLIHEVYHSNLRPSAIGALAQCVQAAFREGDSAAIGILRGAAERARSVGAVGRATPRSRGRAIPVRARRRHLPRGALAARRARAPAAGGRARKHHGRCSTGSRPPAPCALALQEAARRRARPGLQTRLMSRDRQSHDSHVLSRTSGRCRARARAARRRRHSRQAAISSSGCRPDARPSASITSWCAARSAGLSTSRGVTTFNLDEFLGIPPSHPGQLPHVSWRSTCSAA